MDLLACLHKIIPVCLYWIFINFMKGGNRRAILTDQNLGNKNLKFLWLDWKNNCDQTYSCPKRLPSLGIIKVQLRTSLNTNDITCTIVLRGLRGILIWVPIMPRDARLSDSECKFFRSSVMTNQQPCAVQPWEICFAVISPNKLWSYRVTPN